MKIVKIPLNFQADLYAGALFITEATKTQGDPRAIYLAILVLLVVACIFTVAGGLSAVIWTDFVQTVLMVIGALVVCIQGQYCKQPLHTSLGSTQEWHIFTSGYTQELNMVMYTLLS